MIKYILTIFIITASFAHAEQNRGTIHAEIDGKLIYLPLLKSDIEADIEGDLAIIKITQTFANPSNKPIHAKYLFPMNKDAAVYAMTMVVGEDVTKAVIQTKEEAKRTFNNAKKAGKVASLLSQHRPNMFTQDIANLMPGLPIKVTIKYSQVVPKIDGNYELVVPLIVGPRYQPASAGKPPLIIDDNVILAKVQSSSKIPFNVWEIEELPDYPLVNGLTLPKVIDRERVSIAVNINADIDIQHVFSDSHEISVDGSNEAKKIALKKNRVIDNSDFVLKYQLSGDMTQAGFLSSSEGEGEGYFSLLIEPPAAPTSEQISKREMVFVLDTSGSMHGEPILASKTFMRQALKNLRSGDVFRIISFNNAAHEYTAYPQAASRENIAKGLQYVDGLDAAGGTEIDKSITQAFNVAPQDGVMRIVVFLTDGYIGNEATVLSHIAGSIDNARIFAFGVGTSVNRYLLSEMGRRGRGYARFIDPTEKSNDVAISLAAALNAPVLTDISLDFGGLDVEQITPNVIPDLFAGDSIRIQGKYKGSGSHTIRVKGRVRNRSASLPVRVNLDNKKSANKEAIPLIWARSTVADKMRQINSPNWIRKDDKSADTLKSEVVALGLKYSIVTQWTSFVAVLDKIINEKPDEAIDTKVPLPMVKGVSKHAYPSRSSRVVRKEGDAITVVGSRVKGRTSLDSNVPVDVLQAAELAAIPSLNLADTVGKIETRQSSPIAHFSGASTPEPGAIGGVVLLSIMGFFALRRRKG